MKMKLYFTQATLNANAYRLVLYDIQRVHAPKTGKIGTFDINRDPLGTQLVKKVPIGTRVPKWGPTWKQWAWGGSNPC